MLAAQRPCRVLLVRHAVAAGQGRFLGQHDAPLSTRGRRQLPALAAKLGNYEVDAVYCSDHRRARSTASAVARSTGLTVEARAGLREMHFGRWQGLSWAEIARRFPRTSRAWLTHFPKHRPPGGEPFAAFKRRALRELEYIVSMNSGRCVVVVSHAGVTRIALGRALGMADRHLFRISRPSAGMGSVSTIRSCCSIISKVVQAASSSSAKRIGTSTPSANRAAMTSSPFIASMNLRSVPT